MADRTPTRYGRLQAGDQLTSAAGDIDAFGEARLSQQVTVTAANSASNPATFVITGQFQVDSLRRSHTSALTTTSALTIKVGLSSDVSAFHNFTVSAGGANEMATISDPTVTARVPDWISVGSAAAATTVQVIQSAASVRADLSAQITFNYIVRG